LTSKLHISMRDLTKIFMSRFLLEIPTLGVDIVKLNKALYSLKQSDRQWYLTISNFLIKQGFSQSFSEKHVFFKKNNNLLVCIIGLYVDDIIITGYKNKIRNIVK